MIRIFEVLVDEVPQININLYHDYEANGNELPFLETETYGIAAKIGFRDRYFLLWSI